MGAKIIKASEDVLVTPVIDQSFSFSRKGIRLSYLTKLLYQFPYDEIRYLTTQDVCDLYIKPITQQYNCSYCEYVECLDSSAVGDAKAYISHAWKSRFVKVIEALMKYFYNDQDIIIWFDLASVNQHKIASRDLNWWKRTLLSRISHIGQTVLVIAPWSDPIPLTRAWCLWEIYCTIEAKRNFAIALSAHEDKQLIKDIDEHSVAVMYKLLTSISILKSTCTREEDRKAIFQAIESTIGFSSLDERIFQCIREWVLDRYFQEHIQRIEDHPDHPETLQAMNNLAELFLDQEKLEEAEPLLSDCLSKRRLLLGNQHPDTLTTLENLGYVYSRIGSLRQAKELYKESLQGRSMVMGKDHPETIATMQQLAMIYNKLDQNTTAKNLLTECYEMKQSIYGLQHPSTLQTMHDLGVLHEKLQLWESGEELLLNCLLTRKSILGPNHPETLQAMHSLGNLYGKQGAYEKAEHLLVECLEKRELIFGQDHSLTILTDQDLQGIYKCLRMEHQPQQSQQSSSSTSILPSPSSSPSISSKSFRGRLRSRTFDARSSASADVSMICLPSTLKIVYESALIKVGALVPTMKQRWFRLTSDNIIRYYADETCLVLKGSLEVSDIQEISELKKGNWFDWKMKSKEIHGGKFQLQCHSPDIYEEWKAVLSYR